MLALPPGTIEAFGLYLARCSAFVVASPILGTATGFASYRIALSVAASVCLYMATGAPLATSPGPALFGLWILREIAIGLALSFGLQATLLAVRVGGEMIGQEMGFNLARIVDPQTGVSTPIISQVYEILFILGFLAIDGHHVLLRALSSSFDRAPIAALDLGASLPATAGQLFAQMFVAGIAFAIPVLAVLFALSLLLGVLARAVPQMHVGEIGYTARVAAGLLAMFLFAPIAAPALRRLHDGFEHGIDRLVFALGS